MSHEKPKGSWDEYLPDVQLGINTTVHAITQKTPTELLFGRRVVNTSEGILNDVLDDVGNGVSEHSLSEDRQNAKELIDNHQNKDKERNAATKKKLNDFKEGDLVRVVRAIPSMEGQSRKLESKLRGPYRIKRVLPNDRFVIEDTPLTRKGKHYEAIVALDKIYPWLSFNTANDESSSDNEAEQSGDGTDKD